MTSAVTVPGWKQNQNPRYVLEPKVLVSDPESWQHWYVHVYVV